MVDQSDSSRSAADDSGRLDFDTELDRYVEAFEEEVAENDSLSIEGFLPAEDHPLYRKIVTEMIRVELEWRHQRGHTSTLEEYIDRFPWLADDEASRNIIEQEELRCRESELVKGNHDESNVDFADQSNKRAGRLASDSTLPWPEVGDRVLDFEVIDVLGQGTFGRVFLAIQGELSQRKVVLKFTKGVTMEPQWLARLQHSNIVPIYSVHRFGPFQVICMPFFGRQTLIHELEQDGAGQPNSKFSATRTDSPIALAHTQPATSSIDEQSFSSTARKTGIERVSQAETLSDLPTARGSLAKSQPVTMKSNRKQEQLRVGRIVDQMVNIASGLAHAHRRDVLHGDLKPANILIADDGTPMILDFSLSKTRKSQASEFQIAGGTLPYMSPEQLRTMDAGGSVTLASDVYSLGVVFYQWLFGDLPYETPAIRTKAELDDLIKQRDSFRAQCPPNTRWLSPDLWQIVSKCLDVDPSRRYESSQSLYEDLEAHRQHRELQHAPNTSVMERVRKWRMRHPLLGSVASLLIACLMLIGLLSVVGVVAWQNYQEAAAIQSVRRFEDGLSEVQSHLSSEPLIVSDPIEAYEDSIRLMSVWKDDKTGQFEPLDQLVALDAETQKRTVVQVAELQFLTAALLVAKPSSFPEINPLERALELNVAAQRLFAEIDRPFPNAYLEQRAILCDRLGRPEEASRFRERISTTADGSDSQQAYLDAVAAYSNGDYQLARQRSEAATEANPVDFAAWFVQGNVLYKLRRFVEAEACYTRCLTLQPTSSFARLHRGLCRIESQQWDSAREDLNRLLGWELAKETILFNLALCDYQTLDFPKALEKLDRVLSRDPKHIRALLLRSRVRLANGNAEGSETDRQQALQMEPEDTDERVSMGVAQLASDPKRAADLFRSAWENDPRSYAAILNLSHVYAMYLEEDEKAIEMLDSLVELYPEDAHARSSRAVILARLSRDSEALAAVSEVLSVDDSTDTHYQVACVYSLLAGQLDQKRKQLDSLDQEVVENSESDQPDERVEKQAELEQQRDRFLKLSAQHLRKAATDREYATNAFRDDDLAFLREHRWGKETLAAIQILFGEVR